MAAIQDSWDAFDARLKTRLEVLRGHVEPYTFNDLAIHLRDYKRRRASTIQSRLVQLAFMERHPEMPVHLRGDRATLVHSFYRYVRHRELVEGAPATTLVNDHKAIRALGDFLGIPKEVWPTAPTVPVTDERWVPTPEQVYDLLHAEYTPNAWSSYSNALVKAFLLLDFGIGVRFPSEAHALQLDDFDPIRHLLVVTEPKKSMRRRTLMLEPEWMCCSKSHASLGNYLIWRRKVDPHGEQGAFFLRPDGLAFESKAGMAKFVNDLVKPKFPWFSPYLGRHWCANARLIDWDFDYIRVADWLGHESVDITRRAYEHNARILLRLHGKHWTARIGRRSRGKN